MKCCNFVAFGNIVGQDTLKKILISSIESDRVNHAYVFCGPVGIGKRTLARAFSGELLCEHRECGPLKCEPIFSEQSTYPCGKCDSCKTFLMDTNPDFYYLESEGNSIGIDEIRELQKDLNIKPLYSKRKVYVIADADKMTVQAQNCLLKTLEEPPSFVVIVLTSSKFESLLETIISRVLRFELKRGTNVQIGEILETNFPEFTNKEFVVFYADGNIGTALKIASDETFMNMRERILDFIIALADKNFDKIYNIHSFFEDNKTDIDKVLDIFVMFFRDLLAIKTYQSQNILINSDKKDIMISNADKFTVDRLINSIDNIENVRMGISQNANFSLAIEYLLLMIEE